ncbi:homeodomain-interacting protein kinase 1 [Pleuronectes platessa]|uniref:homeodomain-interacting protein kinase 1 n=1 Tax=Pleuronectes platessa TaxID=8262 RepID=UPI00232A7486|nr:homeodomain-interacting protein kinase 1 [Pleuronectes platessa]
MLKVISGLDADLTNMVKFHEEFQHLDQTCLVFERLDMSLYDLLEQREWEHRPLHEIRPVSKQLLVALDALKGLGVLHTHKIRQRYVREQEGSALQGEVN